MRSLRALVGVAAVLTFLGFSSLASAAPITVDDFNTAFSPNPILLAGPGGTDQSAGQAGAGILGTRKGGVQNTSLAGNITMQIDTVLDQLSIGNISAATTSARIGYVFAAIDVSSLTELLFAQITAVDDQGSGVEVFATLTDATTATSTQLKILTNADVGTPLSFPLAGFAGVDLTQITRVFFSFQLTTDQDLRFQAPLQFNGTQNGVPEPSSLLLWGSVALLGGWVSRRKLMKMRAA